GDPVAPPLKHNGSVFRATFGADGSHVLTASLDGLARVWEVGLAPRPAGDRLDDGPARQTVVSPDGRRTPPPAALGRGKVRDASSGVQLGEDLTHGAAVLHAAFSADGSRVLTASEDRTAQVWDAVSGKPIGRPLRHGSSVVHAAFSPDGTRVATASTDNT